MIKSGFGLFSLLLLLLSLRSVSSAQEIEGFGITIRPTAPVDSATIIEADTAELRPYIQARIDSTKATIPDTSGAAHIANGALHTDTSGAAHIANGALHTDTSGAAHIANGALHTDSSNHMSQHNTQSFGSGEHAFIRYSPLLLDDRGMANGAANYAIQLLGLLSDTATWRRDIAWSPPRVFRAYDALDNTLFEVDATGGISSPRNSSCKAYRDGGIQLIPPGTNYRIKYDLTSWDTQWRFCRDTTQSHYQAKVKGKYLVTARVTFTRGTGPTAQQGLMYLVIVKGFNGSVSTNLIGQSNRETAVGSYMCLTVSGVVSLDKDELVAINLYNENVDATVAVYTGSHITSVCIEKVQ